MAGQASGNGGQGITEGFGELQTPVGDWYADHFVFLGSSAEPIQRTGRVTSRTLIGGAAILAIFEIPSSGARFAALVTFDPRNNQYELSLVDANSEMGLGLLVSKPVNQRAPADVRARFGKFARVIREWTVAQSGSSLGGTATDLIIAVLPVAAAEAGLTEGGAAVGSMRIVEILVNSNRWILQFFFSASDSGSESLAAELVCSRIQPGCQPQLGCELGCPGLVGCAEGCEGFQPSNGVPVGQPTMMGQAQCECTAQTIGQVQPGCRPSRSASRSRGACRRWRFRRRWSWRRSCARRCSRARRSSRARASRCRLRCGPSLRVVRGVRTSERIGAVT